MMKIKLLSLGLISTLLFASCKKDKDLAAPTITFQNGVSSHTGTSATDTEFETTITIDAPAELTTIKVFKVTGSGKTTETTITDFTSKTQHIFQYKFMVGNYEVEATDKNDKTTSANFTFTAFSAPAGEITSYSAKIMGAQFNNGIGSFFSTSNGTVYGKVDAKANATLIDFVYSYRGAGYLAFIAAPSDQALDPTLNIKAENWSVYNATTFKASSLTSSDFNAITDDSMFSGVTGLTATHIFELQVGQVVYFKAANGKLGVFKVKAINKDNTVSGDEIQKHQSGSIEIDVKVQK